MIIKNLEPYGKEVEIDLESASNNDIRNIIKLLAEEQLVLVKSSNLNVDQYHKLCLKFGIPVLDQRTRSSHEKYDNIVRVTNKIIDDAPGLFGVGELRWHYDGPFDSNPEHVSGLMPITIPDGYYTSNANGWIAFENLTQEMKDICRNTTAILSSNPAECILGKRVYDSFTKADIAELTKKSREVRRTNAFLEKTQPLVNVHPITQKEGIRLPLFNVAKLQNSSWDENDNSFFYEMQKHILRDEFVFHNYWQPDTVLLLDQTMSIHHRPEIDGEREIYRLPFWYNL